MQKYLRPPLRTPLLKAGDLYVKAECRQIAGSVKYRMVYQKVLQGIAEGSITRTTTLTEVTAGTTGVALATAARDLGLKAELHTTAGVNEHKFDTMRSLGAKLVVHSSDTQLTDIFSLIADNVRTGNYWHLNQYDRLSNIKAYRQFAEEIIADVEDKKISVEYLVASVGTGGVIQGVGIPLKEKFTALKIVAVEPEPGAKIDGTRNTREIHLGAADPYEINFPDIRYTEFPPQKSLEISGEKFGDSASAAYNAALRHGLTRAIIIAAD